MGVMLFPSFVLGNASGESGASLARLSLFLFFFLLLFSSSPLFFSPFPLLFSPSPSPSFSYFFPRLILLLFRFFCLNSFHPFSSSPLFYFPLFRLLFILSFSFVPFFCFFLLLSPFSGLLPFISISFSFLSSFFFLRELLVLNAFQDVIEDTTDCNRM